jgi:hypothetical protein
MRLALSWGIQASHEMPLPIYPVSFEIPFTATLSRLFCTTKDSMRWPVRRRSNMVDPSAIGALGNSPMRWQSRGLWSR